MPAHVVLSEVKSAPNGLEFIEIFNPRCEDVDLSIYYLADDPSYPLLPSWGASPPSPGFMDAILRFPSGSVLPSGGVTVIAHDGLAFGVEFGFVPEYAVVNPAGAAPMEVIAHGTTEDMTIANAGEPIALFAWDGTSDLVSDVDVLVAGDAPVPARSVIPKQMLAPDGVDGPDDGTRASTYRLDAASLPPMLTRETNGGSYQRIAFEGFNEVEFDGNGLEGHDETSENTRLTWEQDVGTPPTPGAIPAELEISCVGPGE